MTTQVVQGPRWGSATVDEEGYREYKVTHIVLCDKDDGPFAAMNAVGLPLPGALWQFLDDSDDWAWCRPNMQVQPVGKEGSNQFTVEQTFSTKPVKRCNDTKVEDPLLEPAKVSGGVKNKHVEATQDRFSNFIQNSAHEQIRGPQVEFDQNTPTVKIEQNVATFDEVIFAIQMCNTVNDDTLWGMERRCVKLSNVSWDRKFVGMCEEYFTRTLEFDLDYATFDRDMPDEGTMVLNGHWSAQNQWYTDRVNGANPDPHNPSHFIVATDYKGNPKRTFLDGRGLPAGVCVVGNILGGAIPDTSTGLFLCLQDSNLGHSIHDQAWWLEIVGGISPTPWLSSLQYLKGNLVTWQGNIYIAATDNRGIQPTAGITQWTRSVREDVGLNSDGTWEVSTSYDKGAYVNDSFGAGTGSNNCTKTRAAKVHVEKYNENNFLLLGIPPVI